MALQKVSLSHHKRWWGVTFGLGTSLANCWVRVYADTKGDVRLAMLERYGGKWAFIYDMAEMVRLASKYNLTEVPFGTVVFYVDGDEGEDCHECE